MGSLDTSWLHAERRHTHLLIIQQWVEFDEVTSRGIRGALSWWFDNRTASVTGNNSCSTFICFTMQSPWLLSKCYIWACLSWYSIVCKSIVDTHTKAALPVSMSLPLVPCPGLPQMHMRMPHLLTKQQVASTISKSSTHTSIRIPTITPVFKPVPSSMESWGERGEIQRHRQSRRDHQPKLEIHEMYCTKYMKCNSQASMSNFQITRFNKAKTIGEANKAKLTTPPSDVIVHSLNIIHIHMFGLKGIVHPIILYLLTLMLF